MRDLLELLRFALRPAEPGLPAHRGTIGWVIALGALSGLASAVLLSLIHRAISRGGVDRALLLEFVALCLALPAFRFVSQFLLIRMAQRMVLDLRMTLSRRILGTPLRQLESVGPHRILTTLTDDVTQIREALSTFPGLAMNAVGALASMLYVAFVSIRLFGLVALFVGLGFLLNRMTTERANFFQRRMREGLDGLYKKYRGLTEGAKELKLHHGRRTAYFQSVLDTTRAIQREGLAGGIYFALGASLTQTLTFVLIGVLVFLAPYLMPGQSAVASTVLLVLYARAPFEALVAALPTFSRASIAARKVAELGVSLAALPPLERPAPFLPLPPLEEEDPVPALGEAPSVATQARLPLEGEWRSIELRAATCSYHRENEDETFTLGPIDLAFRPGEMVFIVGGNGSGKTTLAKMILGLYPPESGELRLDGGKVEGLERERYQSLFTAVFSDFFLFDTLLGQGGSAQVDERVLAYLHKLHLERKVKIEGGELSTIALSQGQRKRLALLTAYLEDRPIYLFDEWAADQDPYFKDIFYRELLPELCARGKTVLAITHDDRYFGHADRLIKLDFGQIVHDGAPAAAGAAVPTTTAAAPALSSPRAEPSATVPPARKKSKSPRKT